MFNRFNFHDLFESEGFIPVRFGRPFTIPATHRAVLYHDGRFARVLEPGRYRLWARGFSFQSIDFRSETITLPGQEVMTADHAPVRISLIASVRTTDPRRFVESSRSVTADQYAILQLAARDVFQSRTAEAVLADRSSLRAELEAAVKDGLAPYGRTVEWFQVRDVMMPGDFKKAFGAVIMAKQEGLAALERARGETAALRNLANAASLFKEHPELITLRAIQALESGDNRTLVLDRKS